MDIPRPTWPDGNACAVALTFDFDAEELWLANDPGHADNPGVLALGSYGATVGVPKILELLQQEEMPATFFVPGAVAERYPSMSTPSSRPAMRSDITATRMYRRIRRSRASSRSNSIEVSKRSIGSPAYGRGAIGTPTASRATSANASSSSAGSPTTAP